MNKSEFKTKVLQPILQFLERLDGTKEEAVTLAMALYPLIMPTTRARHDYTSLKVAQDSTNGVKLARDDMACHISYLAERKNLDSRIIDFLNKFDYDISLLISNKWKWPSRAGDIHHLLACYTLYLYERHHLPDRFKTDHRQALADRVRSYGAAYQL